MGKSCSGKDTLRTALIREGYINICGNTTRPKRNGEIDGKDYNFMSLEEWKKHKYIESYITTLKDAMGNSFDIYYGTPLTELEKDKDYVCCKDFEGARALQNYYGENNTITIYIDCPDNIRKQRVSSRLSYNENEWHNRFKRDNIQFNEKAIYDIVIDGTMNFTDEIHQLKRQIENFTIIKNMYEKDIDDFELQSLIER